MWRLRTILTIFILEKKNDGQLLFRDVLRPFIILCRSPKTMATCNEMSFTTNFAAIFPVYYEAYTVNGR